MNSKRSAITTRRGVGLVATAALLASCGAAPDVAEPAPSVGSTRPASTERVTDTEAPPELASCRDVPPIVSDVVGESVRGGNIDPIFQGVLLTYAEEHRDRFAGLWIDRQANGTIVLAFTDDPERHRAELAERRPSPDDIDAVEPPPQITDDRPIGEWGVPFDVVQVTYTEDDLVAVIGASMEALQDAGTNVSGAGLDTTRNRVSITLASAVTQDETEAIAETLTESSTLPLDAFCLDAPPVDEVPEPIEPGTALDVIVLPDAEGGYPVDTQVQCDGITFPFGALDDPEPIDQVDDGLRAVLDGWLSNEEGSFWPQNNWALLHEDGETAQFINMSADGVSSIAAEMGANGWIWAGASAGGNCDVRRVLPDGLGEVEWQLDPDFPAPSTTTTEFHLLVTERACTSASELGDRLLGPQVVETPDNVRIAFAAIPLTGDQNCPDNPSTSITITLDQPLGDRELIDGLLVGPITDLMEG